MAALLQVRSGNCRIAAFPRSLVPKLCLATHLSRQLSCLPSEKQSFEDIVIPKQSLGTRSDDQEQEDFRFKTRDNGLGFDS